MMSETWMVTDLSARDPWGTKGPQYGPFDSQEAAEGFAKDSNTALRERLGDAATAPYRAHDTGRL